ncbi:phosphonate ABC transporter substrate-binding protein [uncultured Meiothermus sp.]|jgi:phosphonate transport system substrate-binding protein|uniref:phosphonate ABC transporter substrate-binding protein n=1 Tax=uncultured Meiothermus sp. TaxID=157471 RepID=UPI002602A5A1|nr:phosphonate ABC transporter substrate-binding protein [uncultured Meiothermus sp.]
MRKLLLTGIALLLSLASAQQIQADRTGWPQSIIFATVPVEGSADATARFRPMVEHLQSRLGINVTFRNGADYAAVILAMQNRQVDMAYFGPASYLDAEDRANAEALVREHSIRGGQGYFGLLIVRRGSPITNIQQARGQEFAFVDPASTSGFRVPMFDLCTRFNIEPRQFFSRVLFAGTHENVILGVAQGRIPVGATNDLSLDTAINRGAVKAEDITIIHRSDLIPGSPIAVRRDLPATLKNAIRQVLTEMSNTPALRDWLTEQGLRGFVPSTPADYRDFRQINSRFRESTCPPRQ